MNMEAWLTPFENDLLKDIIPYIDSHYSVFTDPDHRALAGLSMGGGQTLNIGLVHPETFAWVGGFSSAPDTRQPPSALVPDPSVPKKLKLVWLGCGNRLMERILSHHSVTAFCNSPASATTRLIQPHSRACLALYRWQR